MAKKRKPNMSGIQATKWKKGQSGNPNGRPRTLPSLQKILAEVLGGNGGNEQTEMERIIRALAEDAKSKSKTSARAADILLNRSYGQVKDAPPTPEDVPQKITGFKLKTKK